MNIKMVVGSNLAINVPSYWLNRASNKNIERSYNYIVPKNNLKTRDSWQEKIRAMQDASINKFSA